MKRIILSSLTMVIAATAMNCVSLDEKVVTGVTSQYYSTPDGLNSAVVSAYAQLRGYYGKEQELSLTQVGTDTWMAGDQLGSDNIYFDAYGSQLNSQAPELANTWNPAYQMINTLNSALDRGPNTVGLASAVKNSLLGEAHFLRALEYFTLVTTFGDVTLSLHENSGVVLSASRSPSSQVYTTIIADLDSAFALLPVTQTDYGRATKYAAEALESKVYLTRAYQSYGAGAADFTKAAALASDVIANGPFTLEPVYADLWCVARAADPGRGGYCDNTGYNQNHKEFIFTVQFSYSQQNNDVDGTPQYNYLHLVYGGQYDNGNSGVGIARDLNDGRPFRRLKPTEYGFSQQIWGARFNGASTTDVLDSRFDGSYQTVWYATAGGQKNPVGVCPTGNLPINSAPQFVACTSNAVVNIGDTTINYANYPVDSVKRRASKYTIRTVCPAGIADPSVYCGDNLGENNGYIGQDRYPTMKKFQDNLRTGGFNDQNGGKVQVVLRLAEIYLIRAEAEVALGNTAGAVADVNVLRQRALAPAHKADAAGAAYLASTTTQMTTCAAPTIAGSCSLDFIMDERERELAGEMNRWYDMTRPGATYFVARVSKWNPKAGNYSTAGGHAAGATPNVKPYHVLRPIPQSQIDGVIVGPVYCQNAGYGGTSC